VLYGDRVNDVDVRFGKILRFGRTRANIGVDIYNLLNSEAILSYNQSFIPGGAERTLPGGPRVDRRPDHLLELQDSSWRR
jgi:hypothetical protein